MSQDYVYDHAWTQERIRLAGLEILRHDITAEDLPTGFDLVHARYLVEWLPNKRQALTRMVAALRPGGVLLVEETRLRDHLRDRGTAGTAPRHGSRHATPRGVVSGRGRVWAPGPG
jgi:trans-aconitate methyltransferase